MVSRQFLLMLFMMDMNMPGIGGSKPRARLRVRIVDTKVIMLTVHTEIRAGKVMQAVPQAI